MYKLLKINLARNSLRYVIKTYNIQKIFVPYYLCKVVRESILKENCEIKFYHIDDDFYPSVDFNKEDFILYPNYFGICDKNVEILSEKYPNLIIDNAHSFYSEPKGLASFNSLRKFFDVPFGSYLWIQKIPEIIHKEEKYFEPPKNEKEKIILEENFSDFEIKSFDDNFMKKFDILNIKKERKEKFLYWHEKFKDTNLLKIDVNTQSPFCYPYLTKNDNEADKLADELTKQGMIIYRYWNTLPTFYNEYKFYRRLIPILLN